MICNNRWNNIRTVSRFENAYNGFITSIQHDPGVLIVMISQSIIILYNPYMFPFCLIAISIELINTSIELICDKICNNQYNVIIRDIKDITALATFITQLIPFILTFLNVFVFT